MGEVRPIKPILRVAKVKRRGRVTLSSVDGHLARTRPTKNADPTRTHLNQWWVGGPGDLRADAQAKIAAAGIDRLALRKDATIANDILLSISPQWFRPLDPDAAGTWEPRRLAAFKREAIAFLKDQFPGVLISAVLHLDEATPHVHAVVVPLMPGPDGSNTMRLSGRDAFNPARLTALQNAWETRLSPLGVGPREKGSKAIHRPLKTFYRAANDAPEVPTIIPDPPPPGRLLESSAKRVDRIATWQKAEARKAKKRLKPLADAAAKGALYEAERADGNALRGALVQEKRETRDLRAQVAALGQQVSASKEEVARLRGTPINDVAAALNYTGTIGPRENAIDLVKRAGGLDYAQAVAWLGHVFGPDSAAASVADTTRRNFIAEPPALPRTKADEVKLSAIGKQLDALSAPAYRVTLAKVIDDRKIGRNLGKAQDESEDERTFSKAEVIAMVPELTVQNALGWNILITPLDPAVRHVLLDDLSMPEILALRGRGYQPATILETSPDNHQVVIKVASDLDWNGTNEWFKEMNRQLGDERITGLLHPVRLAGFQNRKDKHAEAEGRFPFVRVRQAANVFCARAREVIIALTAHITSTALPRPK